MWLVYKKELLEILRDKKTLIFSILLPTLIFPVLFFAIGKFTASKTEEAENKEIKVAFNRITITTSHDLDESFKNMLSELLRDS